MATLLRHVLSHFHLISSSPVFLKILLRISSSTPLRILICCNSEHYRRAMLTLRDMQLPFTPNRFKSLHTYLSSNKKCPLSEKELFLIVFCQPGWSTADSSVPRGVAVPRNHPWEQRQQQGVRVQRRGRLHLLQLLLLHPHWGRAHSYPYQGCQ